MDEIMHSSRIRRSRKMKEKIKELENEIKLLKVYTKEVLEKCSATLETVESIGDYEDYLKAYTSVYSRLCKYITFYSDFNCELEMIFIKMEKKKFDVKMSHSPTDSEGYEKTDVFELNETLKDFKKRAEERRNAENVQKFPNKSEVDSYQRNNDVIEITDKNKSEFSNVHPIKKNNNNQASEKDFMNTENINVTQMNMDLNSNAPVSLNSDNNPQDVFQFNWPIAAQNLVCPPLPFTDTAFWLKTCFPQYLLLQNFTLPSPNVCPPGFFNSVPFPRLMESRENGKFDVNEGKPGSEMIHKDYLKPLNIDRKIGSLHDIILSNLISPDEFYAQVRNLDLNVMMSKMTEEIEKFIGISGTIKSRNYHDKSLSFNDKKYLASIELEGGYAMGYSNDQWSRLEVLDWRRGVQDDFVYVFYLDYGKKELISLENLQPMNKILRKYPLLAQKFYLPFILPNSKKWSKNDITMFQILTEMAEVEFHLQVEITENNPNRKDSALGVNLIIPESGIIVNKKLIEYGVAIFNPKTNCKGNEN